MPIELPPKLHSQKGSGVSPALPSEKNPVSHSQPSSNSGPPGLMRERDAAKYLNVSTAWLARARWAGTGPDYYKAPGKAGAVRYELAALERWVAKHRRTAAPLVIRVAM